MGAMLPRLAQLIVYYRTVGWQNGHDEEKILYATSLLKEDAGSWITLYAEGRITQTWDTWAGLGRPESGRSWRL